MPLTGKKRKILVVNCDDFGLTGGVCKGIRQALEKGVATCATAMACRPGSTKSIKSARDLRGRLGLHLQLTSGRPCLEPSLIETLVDDEGFFPPKRKQVKDIDPAQVEMEWRAQIERFMDLGLTPSHLDSHHHIHRLPGAIGVFATLARELGVPARSVDQPTREVLRSHGVPTPDKLVTSWFREGVGVEEFKLQVMEAFESLGGGGVVEVMTHPGFSDNDLRQCSTYVEHRERELEALSSPALARWLDENRITRAPMAAIGDTDGAA